MKKDWKYDKLGNVCKTGAGGTPLKSHKHYYDGGTIPWIRSGEVNNRNITESELKITQQGLDNSSAKLFPPQTVVIAMYGATAGQVGILNFECATNQAVCGILPNDNFIPEFIYYFFLKFKDELIAQAVGNAQPNISQAKIKNTLIPIISVEEQKQIVAILDKAFAAIDQAQANIEKNIYNAKELFQSKLNQVFIEKLGDWTEKRFGDVCHFVRGPFGGSLKKSYFVDKGHAVYEQQHAIYDQFESIRYFIDDEKFEEMIRFELKAGDLIMSCSGTMGKVAIVPPGIKKGIINQALLKLTPNKLIDREFLKYWMESTHFLNEIAKNSKGAAIKNVASVKILKEIKVPLTSIDNQIKIVELFNEFASQTDLLIEQFQYKAKNIEQLKLSILQKAFSGELINQQKPITA